MIRQPRGNALLVGVGGTGKQSLTRLAAHICSYKCFQIEITRGYNYDSFHENLKELYQMAGIDGLDTVFLFTDTQVRFLLIFVDSTDFMPFRLLLRSF
jgi:dynein heavy chain